MTNVAIERVEEIFHAALELKAPGERELFLALACVGDAPLRAAVEEMLAKQAEVENFFREGSPVLSRAGEISRAIVESEELREDVPPPLFVEEEAGKLIGPYKLMEKIGEGGCGVVYLAEQQFPVRRKVAFKIIKLGMDTKSVIARFEAERQALAMMDHPNIARVFDAGATETGRPFFVMELVHGVKITDYCDQWNLDAHQRLDLFIQVCGAIQHAHQKGVIHRDIKPSNVLVTMSGEAVVPKVIDFGIVKATGGQQLTDKTLITSHGQFIGTPAYMSPEQAEFSGLDMDTRSDVYSLGVLLYELLTGRTPFDQKELLRSGLDEMRRTLREREPQRPSTKLKSLPVDELTRTAQRRHVEPRRLASLLSGDLDWIVMKALEKDRRRRYQTANGLATDVQRYLANEPVAARPPGRLYRLQKLVRRNRMTFAAIGAVSVALIGGLGLSSWLFVRERAARQEQARLREESDRLRQAAEFRRKLTEANVARSRNKIAEADRLVAGIPAPEPNLEYADLFRTLGDWHAANGRWKQAAERFAVLMQVNQPDDWDVTTLDYLRYGPALLATGDTDGYEQFRQSAVAHFARTTNPMPAERVVKVSLLTPPSAELLAALKPLAATASNSLGADFPQAHQGDDLLAWRAFSLSLMEYRLGNYAGMEQWHDKSVYCQSRSVVRNVTFQILLAMAHYQTGQREQARSELSQARQKVEAWFNAPSVNDRGYWFDWVFARILLREAEAALKQP